MYEYLVNHACVHYYILDFLSCITKTNATIKRCNWTKQLISLGFNQLNDVWWKRMKYRQNFIWTWKHGTCNTSLPTALESVHFLLVSWVRISAGLHQEITQKPFQRPSEVSRVLRSNFLANAIKARHCLIIVCMPSCNRIPGHRCFTNSLLSRPTIAAKDNNFTTKLPLKRPTQKTWQRIILRHRSAALTGMSRICKQALTANNALRTVALREPSE